MAFNIDKDGNITLTQGDSGSIIVDGIKTDKNYTLYFAIQDKNRNPIGPELYVNSNKSPSIVFELTGNYTDLLTVNKNENSATYYYGIKLCSDDGMEDTLLIENNEIGALNTITVYPKKVEGI